MSSIHTLIDLFISCPSLVNAKKLVAKTIHNPMSLCLISEDHAGQVRNAERMVEGERRRQTAMEVFQHGFHGDDAASMQRWLAHR